ncbi:MAG: hypothetical protein JWO51_5168 [Rhodospirillales bacterium]|nr:hypothetical protein [Rhodospirillales bacterium]
MPGRDRHREADNLASGLGNKNDKAGIGNFSLDPRVTICRVRSDHAAKAT